MLDVYFRPLTLFSIRTKKICWIYIYCFRRDIQEKFGTTCICTTWERVEYFWGRLETTIFWMKVSKKNTMVSPRILTPTGKFEKSTRSISFVVIIFLLIISVFLNIIWGSRCVSPNVAAYRNDKRFVKYISIFIRVIFKGNLVQCVLPNMRNVQNVFDYKRQLFFVRKNSLDLYLSFKVWA